MYWRLWALPILRRRKYGFFANKIWNSSHSKQTQTCSTKQEDNTGRAKLPKEAIDTGIEAEITDIPPAVDGVPYAVQVEFSYDINGIAKLKATIPNINKSVELSYGSSAKRMANKDIADAASRLRLICCCFLSGSFERAKSSSLVSFFSFAGMTWSRRP